MSTSKKILSFVLTLFIVSLFYIGFFMTFLFGVFFLGGVAWLFCGDSCPFYTMLIPFIILALVYSIVFLFAVYHHSKKRNKSMATFLSLLVFVIINTTVWIYDTTPNTFLKYGILVILTSSVIGYFLNYIIAKQILKNV